MVCSLLPQSKDAARRSALEMLGSGKWQTFKYPLLNQTSPKSDKLHYVQATATWMVNHIESIRPSYH